MRKTLFYSVILGLLTLPVLGQADVFNLQSYFPDLTMAPDPNGPDTVYVTCGGQSATDITLQVRIRTDNGDPNDYLIGFFLPLEISVDKPGVTLDTSSSTIYSASVLLNSGSVNVVTGGGPPSGDPAVFPMQLVVGGVLPIPGPGVGPGDHLLASLKFNVSEPTNICVDGTFEFQGNNLLVVTQLAHGYPLAFVPACCSGGPVVPTLTEWGLIFFGFMLLIGLVWYVRKRRVAARV